MLTNLKWGLAFVSMQFSKNDQLDPSSSSSKIDFWSEKYMMIICPFIFIRLHFPWYILCTHLWRLKIRRIDQQLWNCDEVLSGWLLGRLLLRLIHWHQSLPYRWDCQKIFETKVLSLSKWDLANFPSPFSFAPLICSYDPHNSDGNINDGNVWSFLSKHCSDRVVRQCGSTCGHSNYSDFEMFCGNMNMNILNRQPYCGFLCVSSDSSFPWKQNCRYHIWHLGEPKKKNAALGDEHIIRIWS